MNDDWDPIDEGDESDAVSVVEVEAVFDISLLAAAFLRLATSSFFFCADFFSTISFLLLTEASFRARTRRFRATSRGFGTRDVFSILTLFVLLLLLFMF